MRALVTVPGNTAAVVSNIPIPEPDPNEIRVKVISVALNPVDPLYVAQPPSREYGRVVGSDIAGTVDKIGENVNNWAIGDRVAGLLQGATCGNKVARPGGFAEYAILEADLAFNIPDTVSFDEAATLPLCSLTAAQALFIRLQLPSPFPNPFKTHPLSELEEPSRTPFILIYSASTSLGLFAIQLAKLSERPLRIIATASPSNHSLILSLGAENVFDYRSPTWGEGVKKASGGGVDFAVDCISEDESTGLISECFTEGDCISNDKKKRIAVIRSTAWNSQSVKKDVEPLYGAAWVGLGHEIVYNDGILSADATHRAFTVAFFKYLSSSLSSFPIKGNLVRLMPGGLDRIVEDGFSLIGSGRMTDRGNKEVRKEDWMRKISGEKLVYHIAA